MTVPPRSPVDVDDALDRLEKSLKYIFERFPTPYPARDFRDLAMVREVLAAKDEELQRLREERDATMRSYDSSLRTLAKAIATAEAAEAENARLREERDAAREGLREALAIIENSREFGLPLNIPVVDVVVERGRALLAAADAARVPAGEPDERCENCRATRYDEPTEHVDDRAGWKCAACHWWNWLLGEPDEGGEA